MHRRLNGQIRPQRSASRTKLRPGHGYLNPRPALPYATQLRTNRRPVWPWIAAGIALAIMIVLAAYAG
ncbi:hypothetical protein BJF90_39695 [Pseudonocardia sp. CNS-004]|nr:hypothetical protein BJF90_39695 [Pseudonocardia sp. CNS-004]